MSDELETAKQLGWVVIAFADGEPVAFLPKRWDATTRKLFSIACRFSIAH